MHDQPRQTVLSWLQISIHGTSAQTVSRTGSWGRYWKLGGAPQFVNIGDAEMIILQVMAYALRERESSLCLTLQAKNCYAHHTRVGSANNKKQFDQLPCRSI